MLNPNFAEVNGETGIDTDHPLNKFHEHRADVHFEHFIYIR